MAAYSTEKCLQLWKQEALTVEQAIGQLLQLVAALEAQLKALEQRLPRRRGRRRRPNGNVPGTGHNQSA